MSAWDATVCACATPAGGDSALLRLSGPRARAVAAACRLSLPPPWRHHRAGWPLAGGTCPVQVSFSPAGRSFTGFDLVEILLPGSPALIALALDALRAGGAEAATRGAFARQAYANGRLTLTEAEALLHLVEAADAAAAGRALERLRGGLERELRDVRSRLSDLRAEVEADLDFADEDAGGVGRADLVGDLAALRSTLARWRRAGAAGDDDPVVVLVGSANAGKSALFTALTGAPALVSAQAGTTRDYLEAPWRLPGGRTVRLLDTAGWMAADDGLAAAAQAITARCLAGAALVLLCESDDAPLPGDGRGRLPSAMAVLRLRTKCDLGTDCAAEEIPVSAQAGINLDLLARTVAGRLGAIPAGEARQQRLLAEADAALTAAADHHAQAELLAADLRRAQDALADLVGVIADDEVLDRIFSRFCIGK